MRSAAQAYGMVAKQVASPRELESDLLLKAASRLQAVQDGWDGTKPQANNARLNDALLYNRKLWMIFLSSATASDNPLPAAIRQNVANLGIFVMHQTIAVMADPKPEPLSSLIKINRELASGLRGAA
jgi:flagellar biosynthesis activator protein FlaF